MRAMKRYFCKTTRAGLRVALLALVMLQLTVLTASANQNVYVQWGIDDTWDATGGTITATGKTVTNKGNVSPNYSNNATVTFTITASTGYTIGRVEWMDNDSNGFTYGTGTALTPNASKQVSFQISNHPASFQVTFVPNATNTNNSIIAYYGTAAIDVTAHTAPNWNGGQVYRVSTSGTTLTTLGTSSYSTYTFPVTATSRTIQVTPGTAPAYVIAAIKYAEATWTDPRSVTVTGTPVTVTADSNGQFALPVQNNHSYIVFAQFVLASSLGGKVGAWYGTNNTTDMDSPAIADGNGGTVWKTSSGTVQLPNRTADSATTAANGNITLEARPNSNFKIISINYKQSGAASWTSVTLGPDPTVVTSFNVPVSGGNSYIVWVVYASTAPTSFAVTGAVATDAITLSCGTSTVTPNSMIVNINQTGAFTLSTSINCQPDTVDLGAGPTTVGISGSSYTTPAITAITNFVVKFKPIGFQIDAYIDSNSPGGAGSISPATTLVNSVSTPVDVVKGGSQLFTITPNAGYSISHVYVTDTNRGYTNTDIAPLASNTYTFNNIQADGMIRVAFVANVPAAGNDYCQIPPFVQGQTNLSPNVLIIFDNSGSMSDYTYNGLKSYNCTSSHNATTNLCNTIFYGYYDPYTMYKTDPSNANIFLIDTVTLNLSSTNGKSGNYLNYKNMSKVDIIRKVLVGGRVTGKGTTTLTGRGTTADKFLYTDNGQWVEYGTGEPTGIVQNLSDRVRFGLEVLGNNAGSTGEGGRVIARLGSPAATLVTAIEGPNTNPVTSTPMAEALYEAVRYFQAKPSAYNSGVNYGDSTWNPALDPIIQYACQKHFVLMLTDGEPNSNNNLPGLTTYPTLNGYTDGVFNVTTWENMIPANDRASNTNSTCSKVSYNNGVSGNTNSEKLEAVAFYAHNTDLRSPTFGNDIAGNQNLTIYPVYAFGSGAGTKTLHMTAKYGAYDSKNGNNATAADGTKYASPDQAVEWDKDNNCVPDAYFEGDDGTALENGIKQVMSNILAKVASGTAASILSNSEGSGANLIQAVFYPNKIFPAPTTADSATDVNWIGEMQNLWYYVDPFIANSTVREDTDFSATTPYHILDLKQDYVARFYFANSETKVELKQDVNGDGTGEILIADAQDPDLVNSIWRAGRLLWAMTADSRTIHTSVDGYSLLNPVAKGGFYTAITRATALQPYLQAANNDSNAEAIKLISYIRGADQISYRTRKVSLLSGGVTVTSEWKLGDIVNSTPRIQSTNRLNMYNLDAPAGYGDKSYGAFTATAAYKSRGMVYAGANDGMLHAVKLGKLTVDGATDVPNVSVTGSVKATLTGTNLGVEQWAYIPRNALPYLKYFTDAQNYKHLYYVDGPTVINDVAIGIPASCSATDYATCTTDVSGGTNWRTLLIGSMGLGGASALKGTSRCFDDISGTCVKTPIFDPADSATRPTRGVGYSSYFALDITGQYFDSSGNLANQPTLEWEFPPANAPDNFGLGFATSGAAIVRISAKITDPFDSTKLKSDKTKNGKWFAVFASGPTGPIDFTSHRFMGKSDQNLKLFVIDLGATIDAAHPFVAGTNYWVIDTGIQRAFGGSLVNASIDTDRWNSALDGNFQDDALYVGYTKAAIADSSPITATTTWTDGGVLRVLTMEDTNPANWTVSPVISGIGPVTTGIARLQDRKNKKLWLYFGTGRFFYAGDDPSSQRYIMGVQDGCYNSSNALDKNCSTVSGGSGAALGFSDLQDQTSTILTTLPDGKKGWSIGLAGEDTGSFMGAERSITNAVALTNGSVFYTTFKPTSDICQFGGSSYLWGVKYDTGGAAPAPALTGKALVQVSTGAFEEVTLSTALTDSGGRKMGSAMTGKPPADPPPVVSNASNKPAKKILHLQEK